MEKEKRMEMRDDHIKETIYIVKKEIEKKAQHNRLSFWQFLKTQIRFIGWKIWIMQMILQWIIYVCMKKFFSKYYVYCIGLQAQLT